MIITLTAISLFLISLVILIVGMKNVDNIWDDTFGRALFATIMGMVLLFALIGLIVHPPTARANMAKFCSVQKSLDLLRPKPSVSSFEFLAIQQKVIKENEWLATSQFWAKHPLTNWFWPKGILELTPIK